MTLNDGAVLQINAGNYLTAAVDTAIPADLSAPGVAWTAVGHTSLEDILNLSSEGGEATVLGTLQNKALRTTYSTRTDNLKFTLQQFDTASLKLYFGSNASIGANGEVQVPINPVPTTCAFLAIFIDGDNIFALHAPKAEIFRGDDISVSDTESLAGLPINVKPLISGTNDWAFQITPLGEVG